jgi:hypothetical protein
LLGGSAADKPAASSTSKVPTVEGLSTAESHGGTPAGLSGGPVFLSDAAEGADLLDAASTVQPLAQLCVTPQVQTPFLAAIASPAGSGKTFALNRLAKAVEGLAGSAGAVGKVVVARVDAADGANAPVAIASAAYAALDREPGGVDYSVLLDDSAHAGGDPLRAAKAAADRHDEIIRKLESERAQRDEVEARGARLAEALLYETPGSRVDVFVRARRGAIESRLRRFDLAGSDAGVAYRDLVRDMASMGAGGRAGGVIHSVWGYRGQRRLLFWAVVALLLGLAAQVLQSDWAINAIAVQSASVADTIRAHASTLGTAAKALYVLAALALALNLWRAINFSSLLLRGAQLLSQDLRDRRRDLEARRARLNQRVAALTVDAEVAARHAEAAARRAGGKAKTRAAGPDFLEANLGPTAAARAFLAALGERLGRWPDAPDRLVFAIDNLDALAPEAAIGWIEEAQGAICGGAVGVVALDPARLVSSLGGVEEARRRLNKWLQVVVNLPARAGADGERLVARLLSTDGQTIPSLPEAKLSATLAEPLSAGETALLTALAPLAAHSPRDAKRFLNAYRLARCAGAPRPVVALMQAVAFADPEARTAMRDRLTSGSGELGDVEGPAPLASALRSARAANNGSIRIEDARAAAEVARRYALSL